MHSHNGVPFSNENNQNHVSNMDETTTTGQIFKTENRNHSVSNYIIKGI